MINASGELNREEFLKFIDSGAGKDPGGYLGSETMNLDMRLEEAVSTGVFILDLFLGGGFFPTRIYEISGQNQSGKSTLMYGSFAKFQKEVREDGSKKLNQVILVEFESAVDKVRAKLIGANPDEWIIYPDTPHLEAGFRQLLRQLQKIQELKKQKVNIDKVIIFMDTIAAAPTEAEYNYYMGWNDNLYACFIGKTKIPLLNGKVLRLDQMTKDHEYYSYSCSPTGKIIPTKYVSRGITKYVNELIAVQLDSGAIEFCTPEHLWMLRDGTYKEAQYLKPNDSLMPLYRRYENNGYEEYWDNEKLDWKTTHTEVNNKYNRKQKLKEAFRNKSQSDKFLVTHHKDFNKLNNHPNNLKWMGEKRHWRYHSSIISDRNKINWRDEEFRNYLRKIISKNTKENWKNGCFSDNPKPDADQIAKSKVLDRAIKVIWYGLPKNEESYFSFLKRVRDYSTNSVIKHFGSFENLYFEAEIAIKKDQERIKNLFNHKVLRTRRVRLKNEIPVYDLTSLDINPNFALSSGVFVHNSGMQEKPRLINGFLRVVTRYIQQTTSVVLVLGNQIYQGGDNLIPYETPGGEGMKHFASVRLGLVPQRLEFENEVAYGKWVKLIMLKTRQSPPNRKMEIFLNFERGFDDEMSTAQYVIVGLKTNKYVATKVSYANNGYCSFLITKEKAFSARGVGGVVKILKENPETKRFWEFLASVIFFDTVDPESSTNQRYRGRLREMWTEFDPEGMPDYLKV